MEQSLKLSKFEGGELVNNTRYRQLIGSLIYLTNNRLDFSYVVNIIFRFMQEPRESHWNAGTKDPQVHLGYKGLWSTLIRRMRTSHLSAIQMQILQVILMIGHQIQVI
jgi:hypothetical protein